MTIFLRLKWFWFFFLVIQGMVDILVSLNFWWVLLLYPCWAWERQITYILLEKVPTCVKLSVDKAWKTWPTSLGVRGLIVCLDHCGEDHHIDLLCAACELSFKFYSWWGRCKIHLLAFQREDVHAYCKLHASNWFEIGPLVTLIWSARKLT